VDEEGARLDCQFLFVPVDCECDVVFCHVTDLIVVRFGRGGRTIRGSQLLR